MSTHSKMIVYGAAAIAIFISAYLMLRELHLEEVPTPFVVATTTKNASFEWLYFSFEKDGIPQTTISLQASYDDGTTQTKEIGTVEGNCNVYDERDADIYPGSEMIICYYAGFGRYYKVVKSGSGYIVQRKEFEEVSPDYSPPIRGFETVVIF